MIFLLPFKLPNPSSHEFKTNNILLADSPLTDLIYINVVIIAATLVVSSPTPGPLIHPSSSTTVNSSVSGNTVSICAINKNVFCPFI